MSAPAAIKATFADFRIIKTRKLAQFVFELPIEQADAALVALGGLPRSDAERWAAIALLDTNVAPPKLVEALGGVTSEEYYVHLSAEQDEAARQDTAYHKGERTILDEMQKPRRAFCDLPFPQQAGIKSEDLTFKLWLNPQSQPGEDCADVIRRMCGVTSRSQIIKGTAAGTAWVHLLREYEHHPYDDDFNYAP
jgi:hypothetical protein